MNDIGYGFVSKENRPNSSSCSLLKSTVKVVASRSSGLKHVIFTHASLYGRPRVLLAGTAILGDVLEGDNGSSIVLFSGGYSSTRKESASPA
jgi:hypothetical protein